MKVKLAEQRLQIGASRPMVYEIMSAIGRGVLPGAGGERSRVVSSEGDTIIAEFFTRSGRRTYRTLERVSLYPPRRITFRHLEGPIPFSEEEFLLSELEGGTELGYRGEIEYRVPWLPGVGWAIARYYVKPKYDSVIQRHMTAVKEGAEARAARSHVYPRTDGLQGEQE